MKDWIPFYQALVWPVFLVVVTLILRGKVTEILEAIRSRVESGDEFEAGPKGLKFGKRGVQPPDPDAAKRGLSLPSPDQAAADGGPREEEKTDVGEGRPGIYLVHKAKRDRSCDRDGHEYYQVRIFLEYDYESEEAFNRVYKVVYHLYSSDRIATNRHDWFEIRVHNWGQYNLTADVYMEEQDEPLRLDRYLNF